MTLTGRMREAADTLDEISDMNVWHVKIGEHHAWAPSVLREEANRLDGLNGRTITVDDIRINVEPVEPDESPGYGLLVSDTGAVHLLSPTIEDGKLQVAYSEITYNEAVHLHGLLGAVI